MAVGATIQHQNLYNNKKMRCTIYKRHVALGDVSLSKRKNSSLQKRRNLPKDVLWAFFSRRFSELLKK